MTKAIGNRLVDRFCRFCITMGFIIDWDGCSILFFGEYPFPEENTEEK
ncbi:MAG: hypothetical protein ACLRT5_18160 [Lachnospiraceae bacterium]